MSKRLWCVYKHTCIVNNKSYIGITCQDPNKRWGYNGNRYLEKDSEGNYYHAAFARAIIKYGWENFTHEILYIGLTEDEANRKEIELIALYHTYILDPLCQGYNMDRGGKGKCKYETEEERLDAYRAAIRKGNDKRRADFEKHEKDKAAARAWYANIKANDPAKYQDQLDRAKARTKNYRIDPDTRDQYKQKDRDRQKAVLTIRNMLKELYVINKSVFTAEEKSLIFDYKPGSRQYICHSKIRLNEIYNRVKPLIGGESVNDTFDACRAS